MKKTPNLLVERYRNKTGALATNRWDGNNGAFFIPLTKEVLARVIVSDQLGWDHASVTVLEWHRTQFVDAKRCPTWEEMDRVKRLFWDDHETVMQLHVPRKAHISMHDYCLHMWAPHLETIPLPPAFMVGGVDAEEAMALAKAYAAERGLEF